jgi:hypothetical protein
MLLFLAFVTKADIIGGLGCMRREEIFNQNGLHMQEICVIMLNDVIPLKGLILGVESWISNYRAMRFYDVYEKQKCAVREKRQ